MLLDEAASVQNAVRAATADGGELPARGLTSNAVDDVKAAAAALQRRAAELDADHAAMDPSESQELSELEARATLRENLQLVLDEVERQKRLAAYKQCLDDTGTNAITRKGTDLTKRLVTDRLKQSFKGELEQLEFTHLAVELREAGGARGALFHKLVFTNAPGVPVTNVLSEGESRTLSLAAFLTELSTGAGMSGIIFDDPVSSLDHVWRERIAKRLVKEAKRRQVIVFTHDVLFLRRLLDACPQEDVECQHQYVRRIDQSGFSSPELPWIAMNVKERIGRLRNQWQAADKLFRTGDIDGYESKARELYALLREAWEQGVSEVLLNDVVERCRQSVETQKVRFLHDITEGDCKAVDEGMSACSTWMRGHDHPPADGTPFPKPTDLQQRIQDLDEWVQRIRKRRSKWLTSSVI
ncbi:MAG: AAA family ATPase [bacterium]|nr:AAA family ATPase [bacterium]